MLALREDGLTPSEIAKKMGCAYHTVLEGIGRDPRNLTKPRTFSHEKILIMKQQGLRTCQIAERLGCSRATIERVMREQRREFKL